MPKSRTLHHQAAKVALHDSRLDSLIQQRKKLGGLNAEVPEALTLALKAMDDFGVKRDDVSTFLDGASLSEISRWAGGKPHKNHLYRAHLVGILVGEIDKIIAANQIQSGPLRDFLFVASEKFAAPNAG